MEMNEQKHSQAAILGLQHLLAMYAGSILVPIMIASALNYSAEQLTYLISTDIFMCGVATFLQLQLREHFGVGLPVVLGCAFQSVAPLSIIGAKQGSGYMFGALIVSGIYVILISGIFSKIADFFPPVVTGSVITTIGLTLIPVAIGNMGDNSDKPTAQSLILALVTIAIVLVVNIFAKGFIKSIAILIGLIGGTIVAAFMGLVDTSVVANAPLVHIPQPFYFGAPKFEITSIIMMCIIATVSMVESTGVYLALSDLTGEKLDSKRLRNGYPRRRCSCTSWWYFQYFPIYWILTKRWFGSYFRNQNTSSNLLYSFIPCDSWTSSKIRCNGTNDSKSSSWWCYDCTFRYGCSARDSNAQSS